jgi:hypothetical protein
LRKDTYLEDVVIKEHHNDTWNVERRERGVDDKVAVEKDAEMLLAFWGVVQTQYYGTPNCR